MSASREVDQRTAASSLNDPDASHPDDPVHREIADGEIGDLEPNATDEIRSQEPARIDDEHRPVEGIERSAHLDLLGSVLSEPNPEPAQQVFVNRTLRMEKIACIGFDLDWTLAHYDQDSMSQTAFEMTLDRLVEQFSYPRAILESEFRADFCRRGSILDTAEGAVLKMNRHRYVGRAYYGRRFLDAAERAELYRREPINPASNRFYFVDTLFELPEVNIFSEVVHLAEQHPEKLRLESYARLFQDTRQAIDSIHADGTLKQRILGDLDRYLPRDERLLMALERLALNGRRLILITNSEWFYTDGLCRQLFENWSHGMRSWREIFDLVVVSAGKPGFFRKNRPFVALDAAGRPTEEVEVPSWGGVYSGGSRAGLMQLLDIPGEQMLYIGDHIYGDVVSSKLSSTWRTALIVSELEEEMKIRQRRQSQLRHMGVLRAELTDLGLRLDARRDVLELARRLATSGAETSGSTDVPELPDVERQLEQMGREHKAMREHAARLQSRFSQAINPYWGSLFKQGANKSLFGSQVDDFACIYTSAVRNLAHYGSAHYYRVTADPMRHEVDV
ncbi:MAG: HAD-IG family 5'-nucleotidase [Acidobacteriota bacterium]